MYKCKQEENFDVFLARKFYEEKNREDIHAGMRLVYRIIKGYGNKATKDVVNHHVSRIVPVWMLKTGKISVDGCLSCLIKNDYITLENTFYSCTRDNKENKEIA